MLPHLPLEIWILMLSFVQHDKRMLPRFVDDAEESGSESGSESEDK
jgi:hypothetical protein